MPTRLPHCARRRPRPDGITLNLLASALTILTAIALLGAVVLVGDSSVMVAGTEQDEDVIHAFYRAVNTVLRSGDTSALDHVVASNLVFHTPSTQLTPTQSGLGQYLLSLHATAPTLQLQVAEIVRDGEQAVVRVGGGSDTPGRFLGLPLAPVPSPWGQFDRLRIANRTIVELWSDTPAPLLSELAPAVQLDLASPPRAIAVDQLAAPAGTHRNWGALFSTRLLYVDEGTLNVELGPTNPSPMLSTTRTGQVQRTPVIPCAPVVLTAGDVLTVSPGTLRRVWHDAADPGVVAYTIALPSGVYTGPLQPQAPLVPDAGIAGSSSLGAFQADRGATPVLDPHAGVTVALGRAVLPPGATIPVLEAEGALLVVIEHGSLVLTKANELRSLDHRTADGHTLVTLGEALTFHNLEDDSASVLLVTMLPGRTLVTPAAASTPR